MSELTIPGKLIIMRLYATVLFGEVHGRSLMQDANGYSVVDGDEKELCIDGKRYPWQLDALTAVQESLLSYKPLFKTSAVLVREDMMHMLNKLNCVKVAMGADILTLQVGDAEIRVLRCDDWLFVRARALDALLSELSKYSRYFNYLPYDSEGHVCKFARRSLADCIVPYIAGDLDIGHNVLGRLCCYMIDHVSSTMACVWVELAGKQLCLNPTGVGDYVNGEPEYVISWDDLDNAHIPGLLYSVNDCLDVVTVECIPEVFGEYFNYTQVPGSDFEVIRNRGSIIGLQVSPIYAIILRDSIDVLIEAAKEYQLKWEFFSRSGDVYLSAQKDTASYMLMHRPDTFKDRSLRYLYDVMADSNYDKIVDALSALDEELPMKLDNVLSQMSDVM